MGDYDTEPKTTTADTTVQHEAPKPKTTADEDSEQPARHQLKPADQKAREGYARSFGKGWNEARQDTAKPKDDDPFGGGHGVKRTVYTKQLGEGGFGARLIGGSAAVAQVHAHQWGQLAVPVKPVTAPLDAAFKEQADFVSRDQAPGGDPEWLKKEKAYSNAWATENMESIQRYKFEQWRWVSAYTDWMPLANQSRVAEAEMVETAGLMGFDVSKGNDLPAFIGGLERALDMANQLADAKVLGDKKDQSLSTRNDDPTAVSRTTPQLQGTQLAPTLSGIKGAYRELQVAHHGIYEGLLLDQKDALQAQKGEINEQLEQISAVIEFWAGMGEFAQAAAGGVTKVERAHTKVVKHFENGDHHAKKELDAAKTKAHEAEKDPSNYQAHIDSHAHHDNYEEHYDTWGKGGAEKVKEGEEAKQHGDIEVAGSRPAPAPLDIPEPPPELSVGGFIRMGLTALNRGKIAELKMRLAAIEGQSRATEHTISMVKSTTAITRFEGAAKKLDDEMTKVGAQSVRGREHDMLAVGHDLDSYAVEHNGDLQKQRGGGLVPKPGHEIYATALVCVAKIEKYRAISKLALGTFPYNEFLHSANHVAAERSNTIRPDESAGRDREKTGRPPPLLPHMTEDEQQLYLHIGGTYLVTLERDTEWSVRLDGVVARFETLMKNLSGSMGKGNATPVGRTF